ncbi:MAG: T9SS type A sorting domain-containing protein [Saprospiraceae bacterium]|nr:T9SS type A sorting domain-containing protein [Saprospiraceae bacterium]
MKIKFFGLILLCIGSIKTHAQLHQDCTSSKPICTKGTFHVNQMQGYGNDNESKRNTICHDYISEDNSYWLKWTINKGGVLTFILDPLSKVDDLDFVLYKTDNSCGNLVEVRCMASGRSFNNSRINNNCIGETGLSLSSLDEFETSGCKFNDDNYLKFLSTNRDESYYLFVNNYTSGSGFSFTLEGDATLKKENGCESEIEELYLSLHSIAPNPADRTITINYSTQSKRPLVYHLMSINGESITSVPITGVNEGANFKEINIEHLSSGIYLLKLEQGIYSSTKRFIKQ